MHRLKSYLWKLALVVLAGVLICMWISWQGRKELAAIRAELQAKGEPLTFDELLTTDVPPEENFFADPLWEELLNEQSGPKELDLLTPALSLEQMNDLESRFPQFAPITPEETNYDLVTALRSVNDNPWINSTNADYILALTEFSDPMLQKIRELAERSRGRFRANYEDGYAAKLPHVAYLKSASELLSWQARASLETHEVATAFEKLLLLRKLSDTLAEEPLAISLLVRLIQIDLYHDTLRIGMPHWSSDQLAALQRLNVPSNLDHHTRMALRSERLSFNHLISGISHKRLSSSDLPSGMEAYRFYRPVWMHGDQAKFNHLIQEMIENYDSGDGPIDLKIFNFLQDPAESLGADPFGKLRYILTIYAIPFINSIIPRSLHTETAARQADIAVAVQRFFLRNQQLPDSLGQLLPELLPEIPLDPMTGAPMQYRILDPTNYILWSVGWNQTDEGGTPPDRANYRETKDWVWEGGVAPNE